MKGLTYVEKSWTSIAAIGGEKVPSIEVVSINVMK